MQALQGCIGLTFASSPFWPCTSSWFLGRWSLGISTRYSTHFFFAWRQGPPDAWLLKQLQSLGNVYGTIVGALVVLLLLLVYALNLLKIQ